MFLAYPHLESPGPSKNGVITPNQGVMHPFLLVVETPGRGFFWDPHRSERLLPRT